MPSSAVEQLQQALATRYRVERELGRGGMATVYLAADLKHGRNVAIKVMHPEMAAAIGHDRFLREIEIAARLSHPHVLPLFDSGAAGPLLYYVMPWVQGESLRARLDRERQLPLEDAVRLAREIAGALGHAHQHGLVHRDVKPENVLLSDGIALVADFGIARAGARSGAADATQSLTRASTRAGVMLGTPLYMAPEQAAGEVDVDGRADLYALGCVLYEMLAGHPPFTGPSLAVVLERHARDPVPSLHTVRLGVPEALERVIEKVLAKAPADRYATAARFAEALGQATSGARTPTPPPPTEGAGVPHNLPRQRTHFIGREKELAECARLLGDTRLLTLTGIGGCGKTRLALQLAHSLLEGYPDGVWFVDLAPVSEGARVAQAVAVVLGVRDEQGQSLAETLARHVAGKRLMLVLDNCEHLLEPTAALVDALLSAESDIRIVATSREGLVIEGERLVALRTLPVPPPDQAGLKDIQSSEAVRLFLDRARLVRDDFALTEANAAAIADLCRRLDGIPLALELAAARVRVLSVPEIRARLDDRFRLLTGGNRALPRHQTLRATIQWSLDQLTADEARLFRHLAVFVDGWTLPAVAAVADLDEFDALDLLTRLVDKSLVLVERREDGTSRYRMLETFRQFAQEKLNEAGEGEDARARHLAWYVAWAEERELGARGARQAEWLRQTECEHENVLAALGAVRAGAEADLGLRLTGAVYRYWLSRGLVRLGRERMLEALGRPGAEKPTLGRAKTLCALSGNSWSRGENEAALEQAREALALAQELGAERWAAVAFNLLGNAASELGDLDAGVAYYEESMRIGRAVGDSAVATTARGNLAETLRQRGDLAGSVPLYEEGMAEARAAGDASALATSQQNLSMVSLMLGDRATPRRLLPEALRLTQSLDLRIMMLATLDGVAALAIDQGEPERGVRLAAAAAALYESIGTRRQPIEESSLAPYLERAREALGAEACARARATGAGLRLESATEEARSWLESLP